MTAASPPLVSVIMIFWNAESFMDEAIRSVLAQTFTDYRVAVVNDAGDPTVVDAAVEAMIGPGRSAKEPTGMPGPLCMP